MATCRSNLAPLASVALEIELVGSHRKFSGEQSSTSRRVPYSELTPQGLPFGEGLVAGLSGFRWLARLMLSSLGRLNWSRRYSLSEGTGWQTAAYARSGLVRELQAPDFNGSIPAYPGGNRHVARPLARLRCRLCRAVGHSGPDGVADRLICPWPWPQGDGGHRGGCSARRLYVD